MQNTKRLFALVPVCLLATCATTENPPPEADPAPAEETAPTADATPAPAAEPTPEGATAARDACANLSDQLREVTAATDPAAEAAAQKLDLVDGKVRVAIELDGPKPDLGADVVVEVDTPQLLQVLAAPTDLCRLGALPGVTKVRAPLKLKSKPPKGGPRK